MKSRYLTLFFQTLMTFLFFGFVIGSYFLLQVEVVRKDDVIQKEISFLQRLSPVWLRESSSTQNNYEIEATEAEELRHQPIWKLKKVKVRFNSKEDVFFVNGNEATVETTTKNLHISGEVTMTSQSGYFFQTSQIDYSQKQNQLISPQTIKIEQKKKGNLSLTAGAMEIILNKDRIFLSKGVEARQATSQNESVRVTSESSEINKKSGEADFKGKVQIYYSKLKIQGPKAKFRINLLQSRLEELIMTESVQVYEKDRSIRSKMMNFNLLKDELRFTGNPLVKQGEDLLSGEEIFLKNKGSQIEVKNVKAQVNPERLKENNESN